MTAAAPGAVPSGSGAFDPVEGARSLARTPAVLDALLRGLPEELAHRDEGPDTFSPWKVVGHLIHGERTDWIPRARLLLEHGTARAFETFDRFAEPDAGEAPDLDARLDLFARLRAANLEALAAIDTTPASLARRGRHPELGEVTLGELLAMWVTHDYAHVVQIARVLGKHHGAHVGPWKAYVGMLQDGR